MNRLVLTMLLMGVLAGCDRSPTITDEQACYEAKRAYAEAYDKYWHYANKPDQKEYHNLVTYWVEVTDEANRWKSRVCKAPTK